MSIPTDEILNVLVYSYDYSNPQVFESIDKHSDAKSKIDAIKDLFFKNLEDQMSKDYSVVPSLLLRYYNGSQGANSLEKIFKVITDYQNLISDSAIQSGIFLTSCLRAIDCLKAKAIEHNKTAIKQEEMKMRSAFCDLDKLSDIANVMADKSVQWADRVEKLRISMLDVVYQDLMNNNNDRVLTDISKINELLNFKILWKGINESYDVIKRGIGGHDDNWLTNDTKNLLNEVIWNLITLGKVNHIANQKFQEISKDVNKSMANLSPGSLFNRVTFVVESLNQFTKKYIKFAYAIQKVILPFISSMILIIYNLQHLTTQSNE